MTRTVHSGSSITTLAADPTVTQEVSAVKSVVGALRVLAEGYGSRPALCRRSGSSAGWDVITYAELFDRVGRIGNALREDLGVRAGDRVAVLGFTSPDYVLVDYAIMGPAAAVSVPLQAGASPQIWSAIVAETQSRVLIVSAAQLPAVAEVLADPTTTIEHVVVFDEENKAHDHQILSRKTGLSVVGLSELERAARSSHAPKDTGADPDQLALLIYTSGSTGTPKGAMYSHDAVVRLLRDGFGFRHLEDEFSKARAGAPWVTLNFMPLSHVMGRSTLSQTLGNGGTAYFTAHSDLSGFLDDLAAVHPNRLHFVPRVWELIYQEYLARRGQGIDDATVLRELRERCFGDQNVQAVTGSAPVSTEVHEFVERLIDAPLVEGYGSTEAGGVLVDGRIVRPMVVDYKLADVPELGYTTADLPHPRGELLVKTTDMFGGYYHRPELTAEVFDEDGFYRTGDVMELTGPDELRYLDRRNNVIKLSNGEFVTVSHIEAVLSSPPIRQIYVYGNSSRPYLLAVVVPTDEAIDAASGDQEALRSRMIAAVHEIGERGDLVGAQIPRDVIIETTPFSQSNGLLTGIAKLARPKLRDHYRDRLEERYAESDATREQRLRRAREQATARPTLKTVIEVVSALLDLGDSVVQPDSRYADLGGDSLSAVTLGTTLQDVFGRDVPVGIITSPTTDMSALAAYLDSDGVARPSAATVHSIDTSIDGAVLKATDLTLDKFLDSQLLDAATELPVARREPRTVLVTGVTGFLGRYILMDWLRRMSLHDGTVIAVIRAADADAGRKRLDGIFDSADADLFAEFTRLADVHLRILAGDKGADRLGQDDATWDELAESVDLIVDPAALVNHLLPYRELFGPNVLGTAELIRLALTTTRKPYVYISTIGVGDQIPRGEFLEDVDIRQMSGQRRADAGYASGYANSKWAGEVLLRNAHDQLGLPVTVFRCDMILADGTHVGQLNLPDMFTRLLMSVAATGLAPTSFHPLADDGTRVPSHYDGLPVDFLAEAISELANDEGYATFHAVNPHEDGIGLDTFVDWMIEFGLPITRIDDYDEWYRRFSSAIENLPERRRRNSLLPLLAGYATPTPVATGPVAPAPEFREAVRRQKVGADKDIPHIGRAVIENYVRSLAYLDLI